MTVYSEYDTVHGPYNRKDNRLIVILIKHDELRRIIKRRTVSFPKYVVELYINRYLTDEETVDHIDGNFLNNDISNLRIVNRDIHCKSHTSSRKTVIKKCLVCGKEFTTNDNRRLLCNSKSYAGKSAHILGYNFGHDFIREKNTLISNRSLIGEIHSVQGANSVNLLVENTEQEN